MDGGIRKKGRGGGYDEGGGLNRSEGVEEEVSMRRERLQQ